ncbi:hypothetical protein BDZ91DRAFT_764699 [Kalaharituber pfeilii]|nr:hypothetical protein BDZ91DRAFT_764699 [Kalaharituber pfeilii]
MGVCREYGAETGAATAYIDKAYLCFLVGGISWVLTLDSSGGNPAEGNSLGADQSALRKRSTLLRYRVAGGAESNNLHDLKLMAIVQWALQIRFQHPVKPTSRIWTCLRKHQDMVVVLPPMGAGVPSVANKDASTPVHKHACHQASLLARGTCVLECQLSGVRMCYNMSQLTAMTHKQEGGLGKMSIRIHITRW